MTLRKITLWWLALLLTAALATACAAAPAAEEAADGMAMEDEAGEKILRATIPLFMQDWSPLRGGGWNMHYLAFWNAGPMYLDAAGNLHPLVFDSWTPDESQTVWTFTIDPDAVYSDGSAITAQDVVATWNVVTNPATTHQRVSLFLSGVVGFEEVFNGQATEMPGVVALDDSTVQVTLTAPDPIFHLKLATSLIGPVKASLAFGEDGLEIPEWWHPDNGAVTSGPYAPSDFDLDRGIIHFARNPHFWVAEPALDGFSVISVEDRTVVTTMLANGELDQGWPSGPNVRDLLGDEFVSCTVAPGVSGYFLNPNHAPTDDLEFRKALVLSVDSQEMFDITNTTGYGEPASQILRALPGEDPDFIPHSYDPDAAKAALAASAYSDPADIPKMIMAGVSDGTTEIAAQYMAEQWRQILGVEAIEMSPQFDSYEGPIPPNIFRDGFGTRVPDPALMLLGSVHSTSNLARNIMGGFQDAEIDALVEEALTKAADDPARVAIARQVQQMFHDQYLMIPWSQACANKGNVMPWVSNSSRNADAQFVEPWNIDINR